MRVVGGGLAGRRLAAIGAAGGRLRPTTDRVRESLFNILEHGIGVSFDGARVLDLFAGSGALGIEALSRGAAWAIFIEEDTRARALIRENIEQLDLGGVSKIYRRDAMRLGDARGAPFDLVFADPPYGRGFGARALNSARRGGWISSASVIVLEERADEATPEGPGWRRLDVRRYGGTQLLVLRDAGNVAREDAAGAK